MIARLEHVTHTYGHVVALSDVTWQVEAGVSGVLGVNGAGKSTLLRILSTELRPDAGEVEVLGERAGFGRGARMQIGVMPQSPTLPKDVRVSDFLDYMAWLRGIPRSSRPAAVSDALTLADLGDQRRRRIGGLSGGMYRRLIFAQAVLAKPELLILDEPTAGLDPEQRVRLRQLVLSLPWTSAVVISSHLTEDLATTASRILMLDGGLVVFDGGQDEFRAVGDRGANVAEGASSLEASFIALRQRNHE